MRKNKLIKLIIISTAMSAILALAGCTTESGKVKINVEIEVDKEETEESKPRQMYDPELGIWLTDIKYGVQDENGNITWEE